MCDKAQFTHDGSPANLAAAAADGLVWLDEWLKVAERRERVVILDSENIGKLRATCRELHRFLSPVWPPEFLPAPEEPRRFPDAVAEIVASSPESGR